MNLFELTGLYNPEDIEKRTITTGELNNLLGNNIALLKVIGIKTEYSDTRAYSTDKKEVQELLKEIAPHNKISDKTLESKTTIIIKVVRLSTGAKPTNYIKLEEKTTLGKGLANYKIYESNIRDNLKKKGLKYRKARPSDYCINPSSIDNLYHLGKPRNRFNDLLESEFLVTGLGVPIDERANSLDNLIILDGVLTDYK